MLAKHLHRTQSTSTSLIRAANSTPKPEKAESSKSEPVTSDVGPIVYFGILVVLFVVAAKSAFGVDYWNHATKNVDRLVDQVVYRSVHRI